MPREQALAVVVTVGQTPEGEEFWAPQEGDPFPVPSRGVATSPEMKPAGVRSPGTVVSLCCRGQRPGLGLRFRGVFKRMQPGCVFPPRDSDRSLCGLPSAPLPPPWRPSLIAGDRRPAGLAGRAAGRDSRAQPRRRQRWCGGGRDAFPTRASLAAHTRRPGRWCQVMCGVSRPTGEPWSVSRGSRHRGRECPGLAARHRPAHGGPAGRRAGRAPPTAQPLSPAPPPPPASQAQVWDVPPGATCHRAWRDSAS